MKAKLCIAIGLTLFMALAHGVHAQTLNITAFTYAIEGEIPTAGFYHATDVDPIPGGWDYVSDGQEEADAGLYSYVNEIGNALSSNQWQFTVDDGNPATSDGTVAFNFYYTVYGDSSGTGVADASLYLEDVTPGSSGTIDGAAGGGVGDWGEDDSLLLGDYIVLQEGHTYIVTFDTTAESLDVDSAADAGGWWDLEPL